MTADDLAAAFATVPPAWRAVLPGWTQERIDEVVRRVKAVSGDRPIGPPDPFRALRFVDPAGVKAVLIGQDPYPRPGHADGLAFSAGHGKPASLRRVFQILAQDRPGWQPPAQWQLDGWARQAVLLLNPALSIEIGRIGSHLDCGWQSLTSEIVQALCDRDRPPVFLIWGSKAQAFFEAACPAPAAGLRLLATRHPSNDFDRRFMADGSQFAQTADLIDWWDLN
jgi:uracil-DNA glycosylase